MKSVAHLCVLKCCFNNIFREKHFPHSWHLCGFIPECLKNEKSKKKSRKFKNSLALRRWARAQLKSLHSCVHIERNSLVERFRTVRTNVFLFVAMNLQMTAQITFVVEQFIAFRALGGKLFCTFMHWNVVFEISQLRKSFATFFALVFRWFVRLLMHLQHFTRFEHFVAYRTSQITVWNQRDFLFTFHDATLCGLCWLRQAQVETEEMKILIQRVETSILFELSERRIVTSHRRTGRGHCRCWVC